MSLGHYSSKPSLLFILVLMLTTSACEKSPDASERRVAEKIPSATESSRVKPVIVGKTLSAKAAMDALFEVVGEGQGSRYIWKNIDSPPDAARNRSLPINQGSNGEVWALGLKELDSDRAILVTGLTQLDEKGEPNHCHACSGRASTFFFGRDENKDWMLTSVELDVTQFGSHGGSGTFSFVELSPGRPGFLFDSGGTWQGYTVSSIQVFEIGKDNKTMLRTKDRIQILADHGCDESEQNENCFSVQGQWKFVPGPVADAYDLVIDFNGYVTEKPKGRREIQERARYRIDGSYFVLVEGKNPVPDV